tara:strand:- start:3197 stop:4102 length:906 start_codon:yes stop_codon:yes gene_type:complete
MVSSISEILKNSNYENCIFNSSYKKKLDDEGYCLLPPDKSYWDWIGSKPEEIRKVINSLINKEGFAAGSEGKEEFTIKKGKKIENGAVRLGNLLNKNKLFSKIATLPDIVLASHEIIQDEIKLSSILFRQPKPNGDEQEIHMDWEPRLNSDESFDDVVSFLYLEDANELNGATKVIPRSHKKLGYPNQHINPHLKHPDEITIEAKKGSILILNALTWHKGGANKSGEDRGIIVIDYRKRNHKQLLNLKMYIDKETIDSFNENEKYLFGLRKEDVFQKERSFGPGAKYKKWLEENPKFNYKK